MDDCFEKHFTTNHHLQIQKAKKIIFYKEHFEVASAMFTKSSFS